MRPYDWHYVQKSMVNKFICYVQQQQQQQQQQKQQQQQQQQPKRIYLIYVIIISFDDIYTKRIF